MALLRFGRIADTTEIGAVLLVGVGDSLFIDDPDPRKRHAIITEKHDLGDDVYYTIAFENSIWKRVYTSENLIEGILKGYIKAEIE